MNKIGMQFTRERIEDELRHHSASAENIALIEKCGKACDAAHEARAAGKVGTLHEAAVPMYQLHGLVETGDLHRDFLHGSSS